MTDLLSTYILTWRLPVALLVASWAIVSVRSALRNVRIGDLETLDNGPIEQVFMATLWIGIAAIIYPYIAITILVLWGVFIYHHLMTTRTWMASSVAIALCILWYYVVYTMLI